MSTEPLPGKNAAPRPGWLVEDRPDLVVVRSRGMPGWLQAGILIATVLMPVVMPLFAMSVSAHSSAGWLCLVAALLCLLAFGALQATWTEKLRATPEGLELERRGLRGTRRLVLTGRPDEVRPPHSLLAAIFDPHLVVEHAGRTYRFARGLSPEARAWLWSRLLELWELSRPEFDAPPRDRR
jgi:hypothetical protein